MSITMWCQCAFIDMKRLLLILSFLMGVILAPISVRGEEHAEAVSSGETKIDPKKIIFEHLGDAYGWEVPFNHHIRIPLPIIVCDYNGEWHCFSSSRLQHGDEYDGFKLGSETSAWPRKVVGMRPVVDVAGNEVIGAEGVVEMEEYRPLDFSITKNVCAIFITMLLVLWMVLKVALWHKRKGYLAPRKFTGLVEFIITFVYDGVIRPTLKSKAMKFTPYLLTIFFFIFISNLLGLIVVFPGGANVTGNIAVTLALSLMTFLVVNIFGSKHYWKDVFWPDVPMWLKFPIPIMPIIEVFGVFTKPAALTVRLFANMMGGHMIVIVLTLLIFIFAAMGPAVTGAATVVSVFFSIFMLLIDVLVSFIQAFVFTMLSTLFISLAQAPEHH